MQNKFPNFIPQNILIEPISGDKKGATRSIIVEPLSGYPTYTPRTMTSEFPITDPKSGTSDYSSFDSINFPYQQLRNDTSGDPSDDPNNVPYTALSRAPSHAPSGTPTHIPSKDPSRDPISNPIL